MKLRRSTLEYRLLYAIIVAGKSARFAEAAMSRLRDELHMRVGGNCSHSWFVAIRQACHQGLLRSVLEAARVGNYRKTLRAFGYIAHSDINLRRCTPDELERCPGIGLKTSRFYLRWTGRRARFAVLDVHILRWLSEQGHAVPRHTPQSRKEYQRIEELFLQEADRLGEHPCDLDQRLWLERNISGIRE